MLFKSLLAAALIIPTIVAVSPEQIQYFDGSSANFTIKYPANSLPDSASDLYIRGRAYIFRDNYSITGIETSPSVGSASEYDVTNQSFVLLFPKFNIEEDVSISFLAVTANGADFDEIQYDLSLLGGYQADDDPNNTFSIGFSSDN